MSDEGFFFHVYTGSRYVILYNIIFIIIHRDMVHVMLLSCITFQRIYSFLREFKSRYFIWRVNTSTDVIAIIRQTPYTVCSITSSTYRAMTFLEQIRRKNEISRLFN